MSFFSRLFNFKPDPREALRPLWHRTVEMSRQPAWYQNGAADTVDGRFDMITAVLALVLLRMEAEAESAANAALLTELFVEDMDGQLRESGVGDLMVGKKMGKLMGVLGGRLGAYRTGLAAGDPQVLAGAVERNVTLIEGAGPDGVADLMRNLAARLASAAHSDLLEGAIG